MMPVVIEQGQNGQERAYDLPSRLLKDRIILLDGAFDDNMARAVVAQLLWLDSQSDEVIRIRINSPGGSVHAGLAIADTMEQCRSPIQTECFGMAASMGCYILASGTPGLRFASRRASVMAHQVSSGTQGHIEDQQISLAHTEELNDLLMGELADIVGVDFDRFMLDCRRDMWMMGTKARDYGTNGFVDQIIGLDCGNIDHKGFDKKLVKKPAKKAKK